MKILVQRATHYEVRPITKEEHAKFPWLAARSYDLALTDEFGIVFEFFQGPVRRPWVKRRIQEFEENLGDSDIHVEILPETDDDIYKPYHWECEGASPVGFCEYNHCTDPALDDCLHCHQPYERK